MQKILLAFSLLYFFNAGYGQRITYLEKHRPQFHFSPPAHWMNDPNGMVYYKGEYHLFYQFYPDSSVWGPMHWGHAISKDLLHWQHLPIALFPDSLGYIFSGSVVVDNNNTSGFQNGVEKPLVAIFTYHNMTGEKNGRTDFQTQGIAYSIDKGRSWKKYEMNPVISNPGSKDFRDPKVMWYEASKNWIMTLAVANQVQFYRSVDLKRWELCGSFGLQDGSHAGVWECPDLFQLTTEDKKSSKWILLVSIGNGAPNGGSGTQYFVGNFDGKTYTNDHPPQKTLWLDYGCDNYAGVTWSNTSDKRRIFLGWMSNWQYAQKVPTETWRSAMTLPRELNLIKKNGAFRINTIPAKEVAQLRSVKLPIDFLSKNEHSIGITEIDISFSLAALVDRDFGLELSNKVGEKFRIGYDQIKNSFYTDRSLASKSEFSTAFPTTHFAPRKDTGNLIHLQIFIDKSSVEMFADGGSVVMTDIFFPTEDFSLIRSYSNNGNAPIVDGKLFELKSIWK